MALVSTIEKWTAIIEAARKHPGGVKAYCYKQGISYPSYYDWFRRLRKDHPEWNSPVKPGRKPARAQEKRKVHEKASFIPLAIPEQRPAIESARSPIEVRYGQATAILPPDTDMGKLAEFLRALEQSR